MGVRLREVKVSPRSSKTVKQTHVVVDVRYDVEGPVTAALDVLQRASQGLIDPQFEINQDYEYGEPVVRAVVSGWRESTQEEIAQAAEEARERAKRRREWEDRQVDTLKRSRPECSSEIFPFGESHGKGVENRTRRPNGQRRT